MKRILFLLVNLFLTFSLSAQIQIKTTSANLNFRTSPIIGENIICIIPKGTTLSVDYSNQTYVDWIKINYSGNFGYIYSKNIKDPDLDNSKFGFNSNNSANRAKYYTNSKGEKVQSPTYYNSQPAGATAECRDGTYSFSRNRRGTCSHHGGVKRWLK